MSASQKSLFEPTGVCVKICGITNSGDAELAIEAGADALGINLFPGSKRYVPLDECVPWLKALTVTRVAVVVNPAPETIQAIVDSGVIDMIQFHGDESPASCLSSALPWIRAVRVRNEESLTNALSYSTPWLLLDAYSDSEYGGTGHQVSLDQAAAFILEHRKRRVLLAGGLTPDNIAKAIQATNPYGVDVASGVEFPGSPRRKDAARMIEFVAAARSAAQCP